MKIRSPWKVAATITAAAGLALVLDLCSGFFFIYFDAVLGKMWMSRICHALMDAGVSGHLVSRYVAFALISIPLWCVLIVVTFGLGLSSSRWAKIAAWSLIAWLPVVDFARSVYVLEFWLSDSGFSAEIRRHTLFGLGPRVVPDVLTILLGLGGWLLGRLVSRMIRTRPPGGAGIGVAKLSSAGTGP